MILHFTFSADVELDRKFTEAEEKQMQLAFTEVLRGMVRSGIDPVSQAALLISDPL